MFPKVNVAYQTQAKEHEALLKVIKELDLQS